nr:MAG TPA: hypothetical protein [Caudoviricetes sp.]
MFNERATKTTYITILTPVNSILRSENFFITLEREKNLIISFNFKS